MVKRDIPDVLRIPHEAYTDKVVILLNENVPRHNFLRHGHGLYTCFDGAATNHVSIE